MLVGYILQFRWHRELWPRSHNSKSYNSPPLIPIFQNNSILSRSLDLLYWRLLSVNVEISYAYLSTILWRRMETGVIARRIYVGSFDIWWWWTVSFRRWAVCPGSSNSHYLCDLPFVLSQSRTERLKTWNSLCFCMEWILPQSAVICTTFIHCTIGRRSMQHKWRNIACGPYNVDGYL